MSKKLAAKNALIATPLSTKPVDIQPERQVQQSRTRTAVGGMAQFVTTQSPIHREAEELREIVKSFDGARIVRLLDPAFIAQSEWANRHEQNFEAEDFTQLKREISEAGGNVQPIKVRPLNRSTHENTSAFMYEIVFGHRRHRACLELGMHVAALIETVDDQRLFEEMERENRSRKSLSAWEQGRMYQAALDKGLYTSQRKLSGAIGVDVSLISKSIALAKLPKKVIDAFHSPLDVQFRWAQPLAEALQKDPDGLIRRAEAIIANSKKEQLGANAVFARLIEPPINQKSFEWTAEVRKGDHAVGTITVDRKGAVILKLDAGNLNVEKHDAFLKAIESIIEVPSS